MYPQPAEQIHTCLHAPHCWEQTLCLRHVQRTGLSTFSGFVCNDGNDDKPGQPHGESCVSRSYQQHYLSTPWTPLLVTSLSWVSQPNQSTLKRLSPKTFLTPLGLLFVQLHVITLQNLLYCRGCMPQSFGGSPSCLWIDACTLMLLVPSTNSNAKTRFRWCDFAFANQPLPVMTQKFNKYASFILFFIFKKYMHVSPIQLVACQFWEWLVGLGE